MSWGRVAAVLLVALGACAPPPAPVAPAAKAPPPPEDAIPGFLAEDEVDLPARPREPIEPVYPAELRALGIEGEVRARVGVLADGTVGRAELVASSHAAFTEAARAALRRARFHPALRGGRPVASWVELRLRFRLEPR
jgi:protein TonB